MEERRADGVWSVPVPKGCVHAGMQRPMLCALLCATEPPTQGPRARQRQVRRVLTARTPTADLAQTSHAACGVPPAVLMQLPPSRTACLLSAVGAHNTQEQEPSLPPSCSASPSYCCALHCMQVVCMLHACCTLGKHGYAMHAGGQGRQAGRPARTSSSLSESARRSSVRMRGRSASQPAPKLARALTAAARTVAFSRMMRL